MDAILDPPFATRLYPSPRTGQEVSVHVKEMLLAMDPREYVERQRPADETLGHHLLATDIRGGRAWRPQESVTCLEEFGTLPREHPWVEVWEIETRDQVAVLDLVMFTGFYTDKTIVRFEKFAQLALPLIQNHSAIITKASAGGVLLDVSQVGDGEWQTVAEEVIAFDEEYFSLQHSRSAILRGWHTSRTLWFGHC